MQTILNILKENLVFTILGAITLVQIAPIKIDPWSSLGRLIKLWLVGDIEADLKNLTTEVYEEKINNKRWNILNFTNSCRRNEKHTKEEWDHCISELKWYESYCEKKGIENGVIEESTKYLRDTYQDRLDKNDFL